MKDKTKKIIAGIGISAILATGGLCMTGCTELSETDTTKVMGVIDNADTFMSDIKKDMDDLNANLDELQGSVNGLKEEKNYTNEEGILVNDTCHEEWDKILDEMIFLWHESKVH